MGTGGGVTMDDRDREYYELRAEAQAEVEERFWSRVDRRESDDCWPWVGNIGSKGYGRMSVRGKMVAAHRLAWILEYGEIPSAPGPHGTCVCHKCDNPLCCNVSHLFVGSVQDNLNDMFQKGRGNFGINTMRGESNGNHRLTAEQVLLIRRNPTTTQAALAQQFGVHQSAISKVRTGKNWASLIDDDDDVARDDARNNGWPEGHTRKVAGDDNE